MSYCTLVNMRGETCFRVVSEKKVAYSKRSVAKSDKIMQHKARLGANNDPDILKACT